MTDYFMKQFFVLFLTVSAGVSSVCANLGDGGDRIDDLYGNMVQRHLRDDGTVTTFYHKDRYLYFVVFNNGVSVLEKYSRVDGADLSEKEIAKFLKANAGRTATWIHDETGTVNHDKSAETPQRGFWRHWASVLRGSAAAPEDER